MEDLPAVTYEYFEEFIFRCPLLPLDFICPVDDPLFREAIYIASPSLYEELYIRRSVADNNSKLKYSLLKYQTRMRSRCTPFGIFSGCGVGEIGERSGIVLNGLNSFRCRTRLDMELLCAFILFLGKQAQARNRFIYYSNSSIYKVLNAYRYVEYVYENDKRKYSLTEMESNEALELILETCRNGATRKKMTEVLAGDFGEEEITGYLDELIDSQVITNNIEPALSGEDLLSNILLFMKGDVAMEEMKDSLTDIKRMIGSIAEGSLGSNENSYFSIAKAIPQLGFDYQGKNLFQTDTYVSPESASLSVQILKTVKEGISVLNKLSSQKVNPILNKFKEDFRKRYEDEEIPLTEALDPDTGIGFSHIRSTNIDDHPLIDGIYGKETSETDVIDLSPAEVMLTKKLAQFTRDQQSGLILTDEDLKALAEEWNDLPFTFSAVIEVVKAGDEQVDPLIYIKSTGGSSAANLLNRFCYLDKSIESATKRIIEKEDILAGKDAIIAEIIHLPESRMGNVILRPSLRKYEIPYLASASVGQHFTIPVTDLMVSVSGDKHINLRSKSLNKKIIPRLSTALNFTLSNLSIYSFLCQLQSDGVRNNISFQWGNYLSRNAFRPRVVYKNSILYAATWKLDSTQISGLRSKKPYELMMAVQQFRADSGLPEKVVLVNGDNKLLIDFSVHDSVELLLTEVKEKDFYLEEFLYDPEFPLITSDGHTYRNEVIINFYKSDKNVS